MNAASTIFNSLREYQLEASAPGFQTFGPITIRILPGKTTKHDIRLELGLVSQEVRVSESSIPDSEPENNASAITLRGSNLESLSDDPEDLTDDLNALAGPAAGPDGGELYVDGFSGGKLPPKSSIREVRLNQNPFSAEYDRIGFGRIEILTKPGTDKFRGNVRFNESDSEFNSRNPFASNKPHFYNRQEAF